MTETRFSSIENYRKLNYCVDFLSSAPLLNYRINFLITIRLLFTGDKYSLNIFCYYLVDDNLVNEAHTENHRRAEVKMIFMLKTFVSFSSILYSFTQWSLLIELNFISFVRLVELLS